VKILAPLRHSDEVRPLLDAGAGEFYCGLAPANWTGALAGVAVHRRSAASASLPDLADLDRVVARAAGRPVFATLNATSYPAGAMPTLVAFARALVDEHGVAGVIVAELELVLALREAGLAGRVHVSSLATCRNPGAAAFWRRLGVARVILPRHVTLAEIGAIAAAGLACEAFLLNDGCAFEEGTCSTTHAFRPFCMDDRVGDGTRLDVRYAFWRWTLDNCGSRVSRGYTLGPCGLCALPRLAALGVESLKVVGREAPLGRKVASVRLAAMALAVARAGGTREAIRDAVVAERGAAQLCDGAHLCYYPDVWADGLQPPRPARRVVPLVAVP
jgi:collagenase-like PrtC family protease